MGRPDVTRDTALAAFTSVVWPGVGRDPMLRYAGMALILAGLGRQRPAELSAWPLANGRDAMRQPLKPPDYPVTPDGRYFVVRGRLWRLPIRHFRPARGRG